MPMDRTDALDRVATVLDRVEDERMPVPVREVWVYGDVALGLDPIERLDVYVTKDLLLGGDREGADGTAERFERSHGVKGVGRSVAADWAEAFPEYLRATDAGYAAPERCLAAHLLDGAGDDPVHLEVCNASFDDNVTQRLKGAMAREAYGQILDPRGVCLWVDGTRSEDAMAKLRGGDLVFPTLPEALGMLGMDEAEAETAAETLRAARDGQEGTSVRGDVV